MPKFAVIELDHPFSLFVSVFLSNSFFESLRFKVRLVGRMGGTVIDSWFPVK